MDDKGNNLENLAVEPEKRSALRVIVHSFFVIPFLIALFAVIVYLMVSVLTVEPNTAKDYLEDVKIGGTTKRWQGAFELSKILSNPDRVPQDDRFVQDMINTFEYSTHERDNRIRAYLAMAMGRTSDQRYTGTLLSALADPDPAVVAASVYALGLILNEAALPDLIPMVSHSDPQVRLQAVIALGNYQDPRTVDVLQQSLTDNEANVRWDAAIALAKQQNNSGRRILLDLLDRAYLNSFPNIDPVEQDQAMLVAIQVIPNIIDSKFESVLSELRDNDRSMKIREAARKVLQK